MEFTKPPDEYAMPPEEHKTPPEEYALPENEFYGQKPVKRAEEDDRHSRLLKMILIPVAATVGAVALIFASIGYDPIGEDFLGALAGEPHETETAGTPEPTEIPYEEPTPEPTATPEPTPIPEGDWDDAFPELPNPDPDFSGAYAWSGEGSEEYVTVTRAGEYGSTFIVMGTAWGRMTDEYGNPYTLGTVDGVSYDYGTNTLTLTDFTGGHLDVNLMGNGFTIKLVGENRLDSITVWGAMYGGSLTIRGPGKLTVDAGEDSIAIMLNCEESESCLMIAGDATVELFGMLTVCVDRTLHDKPLYFLMPIDLEGGSMTLIEDEEGGPYKRFVMTDRSGGPATHVTFTPRWVTEETDPE